MKFGTLIKTNTMKLKDHIRDLLIKSPELRDDDQRLIANIWLKKIGGTPKAIQMSGYDFLFLFATSKLTSPESIRRCRQKIQEEEPELRGKSYQARHTKAERIRQAIIKNQYDTDHP